MLGKKIKKTNVQSDLIEELFPIAKDYKLPSMPICKKCSIHPDTYLELITVHLE